MATFAVDTVAANQTICSGLSMEPESLGWRFREQNVEAFGVSGTSRLVQVESLHGLVATLGKAYDEHFPVELSPSDLHMALIQAFGQHVEAHAERLRQSLVTFSEGQMELKVQRDDFQKGAFTNHWPGVFEEFCAQMKPFLVTDLKDVLTAPYSNTTPTEAAAIHVSLMACMKHYFRYSVATMCGIPKVRLTGTRADWTDLRSRMQRLSQVDPSFLWWFQAVDLVLNEFEQAFDGHVNTYFWQSMFKESHGSGTPQITGWINLLFPYFIHEGRLRANYAPQGVKLEQPSNRRYLKPRTARKFPMPVHLATLLDVFSNTWQCATRLYHVTAGMAECPFVWNYVGQEFKMTLQAGFLGVAQTEDGFLKTAIR
jgi:hypothetical protein